MKYYLLLAIVCIGCLSAEAQNSMKRAELSKDFLLWDIETKTEPMPSVKYKGFCIAWSKTQKNCILYGIPAPNLIILLEKFDLKFRFYGDRFTRLYFEKGKVYMCSSVPEKAEEVCGIFQWNGRSLVFEKEESRDPNPSILARAEALKAAGKIKQSISAYDSISFPKSYYDPEKTGIELLLRSREMAEDLASKNKFKDIMEMYKAVFNFKGLTFVSTLKNEVDLNAKFGKKLHGMSADDFKKTAADYCQSLMKMRLYDEFLSVHGKFFALDLKNPDYYYWKAESYYAKKDKPKYVEFYNKYVDLMKLQKKEKEIPPLVLQRLK